MPKKVAYSSSEDNFLARSWKRISEDPFVGSDQKFETFGARIHADYETLIKDSTYSSRTATALKNRFGGDIAPQCMRFQAVYKRVQDENPSGATDLVEHACQLFKKENNIDFSFIGCWKILSECPKWGAVDCKRGGRRSSSEKSEDAAEHGTIEGNKKAKKREEDDQDRESALKKLVTGSEARNELLRDYNNIQLFSKPDVSPSKR